ncbi:uncharacterized protein LOC130897467 isoform X2 [Diorhabda carinulata]|uniref:uncharacterized protein LOC130897467 isoform X2 n=1 Tax=Diorhabda carinulata TaxID=1163345 RepID=UPI0025A2D937|nr:uncharacterized protein LOC130897467 isoform X2 [Diorhabda carinulata]
MANIKQKRKFGVSKTENCLGNTNKYVSVTKHFESNGTVNKLIDTDLPEITFDINKDMSPKKRIIKFSSASKPSEIRRQLTSTSLPATRATLKKRYPALPSKVKQIQIPKKGEKINFTSQSFRELDMNTLTSNYNYMKFPSETDALNTSFTVNVNRQEINKEQNGTKTVAGVVPKRSGTSLCVNRSKSLLEVYGKNDAHDTTKKLKKEIKDECMRNKRRLLAELKTEIAEFRNTKGDRELNIGMKPPVSKSISEKINEFDSVAFILQNRVIIPNSDDFGSYPLLPKNENFEKTTQQPIETSVAEGDVSDNDDEASLSSLSVFDQQITKSTGISKNSDTELNTKIEQNKMLINKVKKVLDIIKLGVQFPVEPFLEQDFKLENTASDVTFNETKSEIETAVHVYDDVAPQPSKSDVETTVGETLEVKKKKSEIETAVHQTVIEEITSDDTSKPISITDDDFIEEELDKIDEIIDQDKLTDLNDIYLNRPLTRRNENVKSIEDKFRTVPVITNNIDMSDLDIVQAKLSTIRDTESDSTSDDIFTDSLPKEIPNVHLNTTLNTDTNNISKNPENIKNKPDIRNDFPFKSRIRDFINTSNKSEIDYQQTKTDHPVEYTDDSGRGTDFSRKTIKYRDTASNTEEENITKIQKKMNVACNTEHKMNDFSTLTKPLQMNFSCDVDLPKRSRDVTCNTDRSLIETIDAVCSTDVRTSSTATQKCRLDGVRMTFESVENIDIPCNNHLRKSEVLRFQLLPPVNIVSLPTVQKIFHFYIDKYGQSHVSYRPSIKSVGYVEIRSPSWEVKVKEKVSELYNANGFREIKKTKPSTRNPKHRCKFFVEHDTYNPDYETGSETDKTTKDSVSKTNDFRKINVCREDDSEFYIETKKIDKKQIYQDNTCFYTTYSDSSLIVKTIKGVSEHVLTSDSDTNSRVESISESNKPIHSSDNSSQWIGELINQNIEEQFYKNHIKPNPENRWKYPTEKTRTNSGCLTQLSSKDDKQSKKSYKTIETQTVPWLPESISKPTHHLSIQTDSKSISITDEKKSINPLIRLDTSIEAINYLDIEDKDKSESSVPTNKTNNIIGDLDKISVTVTCSEEKKSFETDKIPVKKTKKIKLKHPSGNKKTHNEALMEKKMRNKSKNNQRPKKMEKNTLQGDTALMDDKYRKNNLVDDVISKFRNVYIVDNDTSGQSLSEGEIRCCCTTSSGEIHECKFLRERSFEKDIGINPVKKKNNYFDNWITYYFNNQSFVNNSSSTS